MMDDWCRDNPHAQYQYGTSKNGPVESCEISYVGINSNSTCVAGDEQGVWLCGRRIFKRPFWAEAKDLLNLHIPFFFTCFFQFFLQTVSVVMCGHLSSRELAAAALACTLINVGAIGVGVGVSTACDTYFSQTFGSGNKKRVGLYLQRSLLVMYMVLIPVLCLQLNITPILMALGQEEDISEIAGNYMFIFLPGIFFDYTFLILSRYLQNQNLVYPPLVCAVIGNVFNICAQYVAIFCLGMRYQASAACQAISLFVMCACIILYILTSKVYEPTWDGWSKEAVYDIGSFVRLAIPGLILTLLEDLSYEVGTFIAGAIDSVQLAAQGIVFQTSTLSFMMQLAMSISVNIRVGHQLGAKDSDGARHTFKVAHCLMTGMTLTLTITILLCRTYIARLFTSSSVVQSEAEGILIIFAVFIFVDSFTITNNGLLKGCGKQVIAAVFNVVGYECVGLPIGIPLSLLTDLKIKGMWLGLMAGVIVSGSIFTIIISRIDWKEMVEQAQVRAFGHQSATTPEAAVHTGSVLVNDVDAESSSLIPSHRGRCRSYSGRYENLVEPQVQTVPQVLGPAEFRGMLIRRITVAVLLILLSVVSVVIRIRRSPANIHQITTAVTATDHFPFNATTPAAAIFTRY